MASSEDETEINKNAITWQEFLIEAVRARPALYSKNSRDYFDSTVTKNLWRDVTGMLLGAGFSVLNGDPIVNIESEIPFKKWTNLRDTMKKNVLARDQANRSGAPGESRKKLPKKYKYYDQMEWILACNKQQTTTTNAPQSSCRPSSSSSSICSSSIRPSPASSVEPIATTSSSATTPQPCSSPASSCPTSPPDITDAALLPPPPTPSSEQSRKRKSKRRLEEDEGTGKCIDVIKQQITDAGELLKSMAEKPQTEARQPTNDELFGQMVAAELKSIDEGWDKDLLKLDIQRSIMEKKYQQPRGAQANPDNQMDSYSNYSNTFHHLQ